MLHHHNSILISFFSQENQEFILDFRTNFVLISVNLTDTDTRVLQ